METFLATLPGSSQGYLGGPLPSPFYGLISSYIAFHRRLDLRVRRQFPALNFRITDLGCSEIPMPASFKSGMAAILMKLSQSS
jgi:hypothetical protein